MKNNKNNNNIDNIDTEERQLTEEEAKVVSEKMSQLLYVTTEAVETLDDYKDLPTLAVSQYKTCSQIITTAQSVLDFEFMNMVQGIRSTQTLKYAKEFNKEQFGDMFADQVTLEDTLSNVQAYLTEASSICRTLSVGQVSEEPENDKKLVLDALGVLGYFTLELSKIYLAVIETNESALEIFDELLEFSDILEVYKDQDYYINTNTKIICDGNDDDGSGIKDGEKVKLNALEFGKMHSIN